MIRELRKSKAVSKSDDSIKCLAIPHTSNIILMIPAYMAVADRIFITISLWEIPLNLSTPESKILESDRLRKRDT